MIRFARSRATASAFLINAAAVLLSSALVSGSVRAAENPEDWISVSDRYAKEVMSAQASLQPESASISGMNQFDEEILYLGPDYLERAAALELELQQKLLKALLKEKHPKVRQDLQIMLTSLKDSGHTRELEAALLLPYLNIHEMYFYVFQAMLDARIDPERYGAALVRLARYTGSAEGYEPLTELAIARTRENFDREGLLGPYRGQLKSNLEDAPRFVVGIRQLFEASTLEGWEDDFSRLEQQLNEYAQWLEAEMLPRTRESNLLPPEIYADALKGFGVRATPEELIAEATAAYQSLRSEMRALAVHIAEQRGWEDNSLVAVLRKLKAEQIPEDQVLEAYQERLAALEAIIAENNIVSMPERDASIRLATEAEAAAVPASFMRPPQLINNTGQYGEFVLVQSNPNLGPEARMDDWSHESITWALTAHEARPGHELQFARLVEDGVSIARANFAFNSANAEGWGLYAEALVHPFLSQEAQLFSLYSRLMRAARMFLDPMINTGQLTRDQAAAFLEEQAAFSPAMAASEADRYTYRMPGQATAYYYGFSKLMGLRTEIELRLGNSFDLRAFNDFILEQGLLPPEMLREAVLAHFVPG